MSVTLAVRAALVSPVRRIAPLLIALLAGVPAAHAGDIVITAGYLDMRSSGGATIVLEGDRGFSLRGGVAVNGGIFAPMQVCNYLGGPCSPGDTVGLTGLWSSMDAPGVFTIDGVTYDNRNFATTRLAFYGSFVLPPLSASAVVTVPFRFDGTAAYSVYPQPAVRENLSGSGVATLSLVPETQIPNRWRMTQALYEFGGRVPAPWVSADIGAVTTAGSASHLRDSFVLNGDGADIWGTADAFHFVHRTLPADGTIVARVLAETKTHRFAKAGIMLRGSTAASSPSAILDVKPDGGLEFMVRYADAEPTIYIGGAEVVAGAPVLLKLTRTSMNRVFASYSLDGVSWNQVASLTVPFALPEVLAGLAVTSHEPAILNTALFDQVSVSGAQSTGNLLSEGDFEGYLPPALGAPGWVSDDGLRQVPAKSETHQPHSGAKNGACWTPEYLDCGIYQEVIAPKTGTYAFSIQATADRTGGLVGVNVNGVTAGSANVDARGFGAYAPYTVPFNAAAGDVIRVWMYSPARPGYVVIDDAGLTVQ